MKKEKLFEAKGVNKTFGLTKALIDVSIEMLKGEVHGLIGENGSGKSTLSYIIAGMCKPNSEEMVLEGQKYTVKNAIDAIRKGICIVVQEQGTFSNMTVAENIFVGSEELFCANGLLQTRKMNNAAKEILASINMDHIKPETDCGKLTFEERKLVEIARAVYYNPKLLIIDETTTALTKSGRTILYNLMSRLCREGKAVLFISHDIEEIIEYCDSLTILRDGRNVTNLKKDQFDPNTIKQLMVGRQMSGKYYRTDYNPKTSENIALTAKNLSGGVLNNISLQLHKGEILGIGGLTDCGMHELGRALFDLETLVSGEIVINGGTKVNSIFDAINNGIGYISKNRDEESLMTAATIRDNLCLPSLKKLSRGGLISKRSTRTFSNKWTKRLSIKMESIDQYVSNLSGGNKQKVAIAKWLGYDANIFIMDCPTRGIDVGVKAAVYRLMEELKAQGKSIIMISEELTELIGMSDNILIMKKGKIGAKLSRSKDLSENKIIEYMI